MDFILVKSSNISSVGFEPYQDDTKGNLIVRFLNGSAYRYAAVPELLYVELLAAASVGQYFSGAVRGIFGSERLDDWTEERDDSIVDETVESGIVPEEYGGEDDLEEME